MPKVWVTRQSCRNVAEPKAVGLGVGVEVSCGVPVEVDVAMGVNDKPIFGVGLVGKLTAATLGVTVEIGAL